MELKLFCISNEKRKMIKAKRILIIGGLGFLGKNLYLKLKELSISAHLFSNTPLHKNDVFKDYADGNDIVIGDITNKEQLAEIISDYDVIFSFAGISGASESIFNPIKDINTNLIGHINILESCREKNPHAQLIFPSTRLVYGKPEYLPVNESQRTKPESIYAIHKITVEQYYQLYHKVYGINSTIFRISNPYGPFQIFGDKKYGMLNWFIYKAFKSEMIEIFGTGDQKRDYIFVDDLSELFIKSIGKESINGKIYNIGYGQGISILEMIQIIHKFVPDAKYTFKEWPKIYKIIETGDYISNIEAIKKDLGWFPKTPFEEGMRRTIEFYKFHHE